MSKKDKNEKPAPQAKEEPEKKAPEAGQSADAAPTQDAEKASEQPEKKAPETFTLTREQMEKMEGLAKQLAALSDQHLRLAAEYDNYRKRTTREKENIYQDAKIDTIAKFLDVYDNLERAVKQEGGEDNVHKKGMEMIFHQLENILASLGVAVEDPVGQPFDPTKHNAVMHIEDEKLGENVVAQVFQKGFLLGGRVVRTAAVQVAN